MPDPLSIGRDALARGDARGALPALQRALKSARASGDPLAEAWALTELGRACVEVRLYPKARALHETALRLHTRADDRPGAAASLGGLGLCYLGTGAPADGVRRLNQAIVLCAELGDLAAESAWRAHLDGALVLLEREEHRIVELRRWIEVARQLGDAGLQAALHCELGNSLRSVRDPTAALVAYGSALALSETRGDPGAQAIDHANLGRAHRELGDEASAREAFRRALELCPADRPALRAEVEREAVAPEAP